MSHPYQPPNQLYWKGRQSVKPEYWHQAVHLVDLENPDFLNANMAFIGYQCEEGVKRNQGRLGTKAGPNAIREILGKLPIHREDVSLADCGDLIFEEKTDLLNWRTVNPTPECRLIRVRSIIFQRFKQPLLYNNSQFWCSSIL